MAQTSGTADWSSDMDLALHLANDADVLTLDRFRALDLSVETKPDLTPVTDADRAVETHLRRVLTQERREDAVLGEEFGWQGHGDREWIVDPIDGTKNYVRGVPVWASLIALRQAGVVQVGVVSAPALNTRWWAARGLGAWSAHHGAEPRRLQVSAVSQVRDASVSYSDIDDQAWVATGTASGFHALLEAAWRTRAYGDFWSHMLVAEGAVDVAVEPELGAWDMAALIPIVEEAGGRVTSLTGSDPIDGGNAVSTNGLLHDDVLAWLRTHDSGG